MSSDNTNVLGIDIGGTKIAVCITDAKGNILASDRIASGAAAPYEEALPQVVYLAQALIKKAGLKHDDISGCGICAPGPLDMAGGRIMKSPNMSWDAVPIRDDLVAGLSMPVFMDNDANAGVLAEWFFGCAKGKTDVIYLTMSTGVGGGIVAGGKLLAGTTGIAGELGHIVLDPNGPLCGCGQLGCLEAFCGGRSVALQLQDKLRFRPDHAMYRLPDVQGKLENLNFQAVREGAKLGIPLAVEMWNEICLRLAQGIGICMVTFNPQMIVLGTAAFYAGDFMLQPVLAQLPRFAWKEFRDSCEVCITGLGPKVGELAGASVALNGLYEAGKITL
ncbi:ROK family protein [Oligosphaera ethanolica]|uniref:Glucokinase n=1 Tax=Oligosphaera ethanolica TaxID=760260 RepID=A0AAE3VD16_9BACT|nr:ROK family protein [Oligosphaera ethanolica]MDQ0288230.1 glucokinase [Oligosphaera ethanolica]NLE56229.1 ROK family protein [Lentisphaerota bacterium]